MKKHQQLITQYTAATKRHKPNGGHGRSNSTGSARTRIHVRSRQTGSRTMTKTKTKRKTLYIPNGIGGKFTAYKFVHPLSKTMSRLIKGSRPYMSHDWSAMSTSSTFNQCDFGDLYAIKRSDVIVAINNSILGGAGTPNPLQNTMRYVLSSLNFVIMITNNSQVTAEINLYTLRNKVATPFSPRQCVTGGISDEVPGTNANMFHQPWTHPNESTVFKKLWAIKDRKKSLLGPGESIKLTVEIQLNRTITLSELLAEATEEYQPSYSFGCLMSVQGGAVVNSTAGSVLGNIGLPSTSINWIAHRKWVFRAVPGREITIYSPPVNSLPVSSSSIPVGPFIPTGASSGGEIIVDSEIGQIIANVLG